MTFCSGVTVRVFWVIRSVLCPLTKSLNRAHRVAIQVLSEEDGRHLRAKHTYEARGLRYLRGLDCIYPPEKEGRRSAYRSRYGTSLERTAS